ncbi:P-loop containing nucleoside triphosphate hydrolase protein [Mycena crocata]|nr:P-loop containing nucleoside triphosphate hydrolase protein [Mycena crocata]
MALFNITTPAQWVDRRGATRTVPMQVLVLGFFRTGTASMRQALETLGYMDTHHMISVAVTDAPSMLFAEELIAAYPDAKVILTIRDPDKWWKSYSGSLQAEYRSTRLALAMWIDPAHFGKVISFARGTVTTFFGVHAAVAEADPSKACFVAHYEKVRGLVPKERLLEYKVGEGWDRLCVFLGKDVPDTPFPWVNDTQALRKNYDIWMRIIFRRAARRVAVSAVALISFGVAAYATKAGGLWNK